MRHALVPLLLVLLLLPLAPLATPQQAGQPEVLLVDVDDVVSRGTAMHIQDALDEAEARGAPLVIQLDTPGGLVEATLNIFRSVERAQVPVLTFVGPRGGFAASAGTFMLLMGQPNGMASNTQIGSAQPIQQSPSGGTTNASDKTTNFLVEKMRQIAERGDRNATLATRFITENLNMDEDRALETGMIDVIAPDVASFLDQVHGRQAIVGDSTVTLDTEDARIIEVDKGLLTELVEIIGNPQVSFVLFLVGLYGLIFGLANPGTYVPETIGALVLIMALIGLGLFDTNTAGLLLILLGAVFLVAEVFTPTHGILTAAGVITLILAAVFLVDEPLLPRSFFRDFLITGILSAVFSGAAVIGAVMLALKARNRPVASLAGMRGKVTKRLEPEGQIRVHGELWNARVEDHDQAPVEAGTEVTVVERDGLRLTVRPVDRDEGAPVDTDPPPGSGEAGSPSPATPPEAAEDDANG